LIHHNYIAIEGNIGSGKTSLATMIARDYNAKLILEQFEDNSFLPKFYKDPDKYSFPLEMSFLADRYRQLKGEVVSKDLFKTFTIADYFIDKSLIFARKTLKDDEFQLYARLFDIIIASLPKPDLLFYLYNTPKKSKENILLRGRSYEKDIEISYLEKIQSGYMEYFKLKRIPVVIIIDTNNLDFVNKKGDYLKLLSLLEQDYEKGIHRISL
jgi:deoxyadenosine/deoxycytidine kinase